jgi:sigma-54-specific transcriptional regulator
VRLIAATNVDLAEAVRAGRFREDLYYRLQVVTLPLKPLRERAGDILPLTQHFLKMYAQRLHVAPPVLSPDAECALTAYPWPGNIRELENVIHRALLVSQEGLVTASDLHLPEWHQQAAQARRGHPDIASSLAADPVEPVAGSVSEDYAELRRAWQALLNSDGEIVFERVVHQLVEDAWHSNQRNQVRTARQLNTSRNILRTYLKKAELL